MTYYAVDLFCGAGGCSEGVCVGDLWWVASWLGEEYWE